MDLTGLHFLQPERVSLNLLLIIDHESGLVHPRQKEGGVVARPKSGMEPIELQSGLDQDVTLLENQMKINVDIIGKDGILILYYKRKYK